MSIVCTISVTHALCRARWEGPTRENQVKADGRTPLKGSGISTKRTQGMTTGPDCILKHLTGHLSVPWAEGKILEETEKTTPVRFELTRAMHNRLAGDPVNHSGKVPLKFFSSLPSENCRP